jgi:hypothetical protein
MDRALPGTRRPHAIAFDRSRRPGKVLLKCHTGCIYQAIVEALGGRPGSAPLGRHDVDPRLVRRAQDRIEWARQIWRESRHARGTIVQDYLFGRGFTGEMPWKRQIDSHTPTSLNSSVGLAIPSSVRFHSGLKHKSGVWLPAMVAAIDDLGGEMVGIHRSFLKPDGTGKAAVEPNKMMLGRLSGGAVRLTAGAPELVLCEGIETGLSILQATGLHVWATLGTSNIGKVELPDFVHTIIIAADHDDPGIKAARAAAQSYRESGYRVRILTPQKEGCDFNQVEEGRRNDGRAGRV